MNTRRQLTPATLISAVLAAAFMAATPGAHAADKPITQLPRVVVTGKVVRAEAPVAMAVVALPRVVVTGRRAEGKATQLVQLVRGGALKLVSLKL